MAVAILSGPERRRRWSQAEKLRLVEETLAPETTIAEIARRHDVHPNLLHTWRRQARTGLLVGVEIDAGTVEVDPYGEVQAAIRNVSVVATTV